MIDEEIEIDYVRPNLHFPAIDSFPKIPALYGACAEISIHRSDRQPLLSAGLRSTQKKDQSVINNGSHYHFWSQVGHGQFYFLNVPTSPPYS